MNENLVKHAMSGSMKLMIKEFSIVPTACINLYIRRYKQRVGQFELQVTVSNKRVMLGMSAKHALYMECVVLI